MSVEGHIRSVIELFLVIQMCASDFKFQNCKKNQMHLSESQQSNQFAQLLYILVMKISRNFDWQNFQFVRLYI